MSRNSVNILRIVERSRSALEATFFLEACRTLHDPHLTAILLTLLKTYVATCSRTRSATEALLHRSKNFIIAAVSQGHRDQCSRIVTFDGDAALLCSILLRSVHFHYDLATTKALPRCLLLLAAFAPLPLRFWRSGHLHVWFKCIPELLVTLLASSGPTLLMISFGSILM